MKKNADEIAKLLESDNESDNRSEKTIEGDAINQLIENKLDENMNSSMMVRKPIHLKTKISLGEIKMMYNSSFNYLYLMIYSRFCIDIEISTILPRRHYPGRRM